jgi:predicted Zn-dependent protease
LRVFLLSLLLTINALDAGKVYANPEDLPNIGSSANALISTSEEQRVGRIIVKGLRDAGRILEDPLLSDYIDALGHKLIVTAHEGQHRFNFFIVRDPAINAFALPGGYIGVNAGLILATENEGELAGVMAHEIAHVTQRHVVRRVQATQQSSMVSTAALIGALLLGIATGADADAIQAMIVVAQGTAIQQQINYTRSNEQEADRVGIGYLASAGYNPEAMADFFETMSRMAGVSAARVPEFLRTHPMEVNRIAEAKNRARQYPKITSRESQSYPLMRERLRVMLAENEDEALGYYEDVMAQQSRPYPNSLLYGYGLALNRSARYSDATGVFARLLDDNATMIPYRLGLGEAQMGAGDTDAALATYGDAYRLFPRNVPVTVAYSEALLQAGQPARAHQILLDLLNNVAPTPEQARLIALIASAEGDMANAHYYMSEYHILSGNLPMAVEQLRLALAQPKLEDVQRARFSARLAQIQEYVSPEQQRRAQRSQPYRTY